MCEAEEPGEPCVPSVPTADEFSGLIFTPQRSARLKTVPMCTSFRPVFSALLNSLLAAFESYFGDRLHKVRKSERPASPQSLAMAKVSCIYS